MSDEQSYEELVRELVVLWLQYTHHRAVLPPNSPNTMSCRTAFYEALDKACKRVIG